MTDNQRINPQIKEVEIGIHSLRNITIYPLSLADQMGLTEIFATAVSDFFASGKTDDMELISFTMKLLKDKLPEVLALVTGDKNKKNLQAMMKEMTNMQASEIARIVFEVNYEEPAKNAGSLSEMLKNFFLSERPLPPLSNDTLDTDSTISSENLSEKEELPGDSS